MTDQDVIPTPEPVLLDPITLRITWDRLIAIVTDAGKLLERTAFSPVVREGKDYACIITDRHGNCVAQPWDCQPSFLGTLPLTMRHIIRMYEGAGEPLREGDSVLTNDPWLGTGDLNDINVATPICHRGVVVGYAIVTAHVSDIGGTASFGSARDVYSEGLRLPVWRFATAAGFDPNLRRLIDANVRAGDEVWGDIVAMLGTNHFIAQRLVELLDETELDFGELADEVIRRTEEAMRAEIRNLPPQRLTAETVVETATSDLLLRATVEVADDRIVVDYTGSSPQNDVGVNSVPGYTFAFTAFALKAILSAGIPNNEGCFRCIDIVAPPGTITNALPPAAVRLRPLVGHRICDLIFAAFSDSLPARVIAPSGSTPAFPQSVITSSADGRPRVFLFHNNGGMGAGGAKDGGVSCFPANLGSTPVEVVEAGAPIQILEKRLRPDSGGGGQFRGGLGQRVRFRVVGSKGVLHNLLCLRQRHPARGLRGGLDGGVYEAQLNGKPHPTPWGASQLSPGDEVLVDYPGGAGFGVPTDRARSSIQDDLSLGFITEGAAHDIYGINREEDR